MTETKDLTNWKAGVPAIAEEKLDAVINQSDDQVMWAKPVVGGFSISKLDKVVKEITGYLGGVDPYVIDFSTDPPTKGPHVVSDTDIPPGFQRRCDVKIVVSEDQVLGLSLAPSSTKYYLSPYLKYLKNQGLHANEVLTRVTSKQAANDKGSWSVAAFELAEREDQNSPEPQSQPASRVPKGWA